MGSIIHTFLGLWYRFHEFVLGTNLVKPFMKWELSWLPINLLNGTEKERLRRKNREDNKALG